MSKEKVGENVDGTEVTTKEETKVSMPANETATQTAPKNVLLAGQ